MKASEVSRDRVENIADVLKVGDSVECKITNVDRKSRGISLSIKAKDADEEKAAMKEVRQREVEAAGPTTIGELIKAQMANKE